MLTIADSEGRGAGRGIFFTVAEEEGRGFENPGNWPT